MFVAIMARRKISPKRKIYNDNFCDVEPTERIVVKVGDVLISTYKFISEDGGRMFLRNVW
jgi:hypothetical protein